MNMIEASLGRADGGLAAEAGGQRVVLGEETVSARPALKKFEGRKVVLGIRPEDLEDAALATDVPADRRLHGQVELREALGSEIMVHFTIDAPPALTEDVRELAQDIGDERAVQEAAEGTKQQTTMVGRFGARSRVREGETADVAVDTRSLHFFDPESGLGIYDNTPEKGA
jgi:multiple sugar transport system ATP-binding protein